MNYLIGIGNYTMFDDSIGIRVVEYIVDNELERDFQAIEMGGNLINLITYFTEITEKIVIIDTAKMGISPGEFQFFKPEEVKSEKMLEGISTHEGDLLKIIQLAKLSGYPIPQIDVLGIEPENCENTFGLSEILSQNLPLYVSKAIGRLKHRN